MRSKADKRTKTDNRSIADKCELRRQVLAKLGEPLRVLDLFSGEGLVWKEMGKTFPIASYTPVDIRPRQPGTIRLDVNPRSVQAFDPNRFNCIDLDCYGEPWDIFAAVVRRVARRMAIFITNGIQNNQDALLDSVKTFAGIPLHWNLPVNDVLARFLARGYLNHLIRRFRVELSLYVEHRATGFGQTHRSAVDYYGLLLKP